MPSAPLLTPRSLARRVARMSVLAVVGATALTSLPVAGSAAPAPRPVTPSVTERALSNLRTVAADTVELTGTAPLVALTWPADAAPPAESPVHVRVKSDKGGWGPWLETSVSTTRDPSSSGPQRIGTDPVWVGPEARTTQIRLPRALQGSGNLARGRVELIDPGQSDADAGGRTPASAAEAVAARPSIVSRAGWGADESLRTCGPSYGETLRGVFVHHTAGTNTYTAAQSASIVRGIYAYHTKSLGWCDIGYHVLVDKYGQTFEGRAGGLDRPVTGAHALGFNTDTWGVSVLGNYSTATPTSATMSALARVIAWRTSTFYRSPTGTTTLTSADSGSKYPKGTKVTLPFIGGHRDTNSTECPGNNLYSRLPALRTSVGQLGGYSTSPVYASWIAKGGAQGLGWVERGERSTPFGVRTTFTSHKSLWSTSRGVFQLGVRATELYESQGGEKAWGAPLANERFITGGTRSDFAQSASVIVRQDLDQAYAVHGGIRTYWDARGGPTSAAGMPAWHTWQPTSSGWLQTFSNGQVLLSDTTAARTVSGAIQTRYWQFGGPAGRFGYPTTEQSVTNGGVSQRFQGGGLWWHSAAGAHSTYGAIDHRFVSMGGAASWLGFPTAEQRAWTGGYEQDFQAGLIRWDRATGTVTAIRR